MAVRIQGQPSFGRFSGNSARPALPKIKAKTADVREHENCRQLVFQRSATSGVAMRSGRGRGRTLPGGKGEIP
jgi:hypothetical protein